MRQRKVATGKPEAACEGASGTEAHRRRRSHLAKTLRTVVVLSPEMKHMLKIRSSELICGTRTVGSGKSLGKGRRRTRCVAMRARVRTIRACGF